MAKLTADREALLSEAERRKIFRDMLLFRLCLITLAFSIICWISCAAFGPIRFSDHRPVAFWLIPAGIFALVYYSYALFTEFSGDPMADRWWRILAAALVLSPLVMYFTVAGMMFLFFTISEVEFSLETIPFWPG
ncbi:MAG: hypothetical protein P8R39_04535 [Alphaproteobacteria bacterium]|nr:hypothetical protein [Alphaproteobacteria bacterium]